MTDDRDKKPALALDEGDLMSEIDAWGDMFDALHEEVPAVAGAAPAGGDELLAEKAAAGGGVLDDDPFAAPAAPPREDPRETDFSELGIDGPPEALGSLLGAPPPLLPPDEEQPPSRPSQPIRRPSGLRLGGEDEVFTSASRPSVTALPPAPTDDELFGDLLDQPVPEPSPEPPILPTPPRLPKGPRVSSPAIVRREDLERRKDGPNDGEFGGAETTRVADVAELEQLAEAPIDDFGGGPEATRVASIDDLDPQARRAARRTGPPPTPIADDPIDDFGGGPEATRVASIDELDPQSRRAARRSEPPATRPAPRGPAIVRRPGSDYGNDFGGDDDSGAFASPEATRIADVAQLEQLAEKAEAAAKALLDEQPAVELTVDEDFYAGFEIGDAPGVAGGSIGGGEVGELYSDTGTGATPGSRRTTAHVVRREKVATPPSGTAVVVEIEAEASDEVQLPPVAGEISSAPAPAPAEHDFADVAAAVAEPEAAPAPAEPGAVTPAQVHAAAAVVVEPVPEPVPETVSAAVQAASIAAVTAGPDVTPELPPAVYQGLEPALDLDALALPEIVDPSTAPDPAEEAARLILVYERELEIVDEPAIAAALHGEAARLYERLGDADRARHHHEAALLHDPRSFPALRGLRRLARAGGDLEEATRHLDAEIGIAGARERRALALHRVDLLMAAGEQDLARVAVGELLDEAADIRALLAQLELAFLDGRVDELGDSLERLAAAVADDALRSALSVALGQLRERPDHAGGDPARARAAFARASGGPDAAPSVPALLGLRRTGEPAAVVEATSTLAELTARTGEPAAAAGLLLRTAALAAGAELPEVAAASLERARALAPRDPLIAGAVLGAASGVAGPEGVAAQIDALAIVGEVGPTAAERTWAHAREASLRLARAAEGDAEAAAAAIARAAAADPGHDHVTAAHEAHLAAAGDWLGVADLALARVHGDPSAERDRVTAARAFAAAGAIGRAIELLGVPEDGAPASPTLADVLSDALAVAGRWADRVALWSALARRDAERLDPELAALRAAAAAEEAVAALDPESPDGAAALPGAITAGLEAWGRVLDADPDSQRGHAAAIALARRLGDRDVLADALARAQAAQAPRSPAAAVTLGLERARAVSRGADPDLGRADEILGELPGDDPRRLAAELALAARAGRWADAALFLEERATAAAEAGAALEAVALRYRAAQLYLDRADDAARGAQLLAQVLEDRPQLAAASDALNAVRRRLGDGAAVPSPVTGRHTVAELGSGADAFARLVREAELLAGQGDEPGAIGLLVRALELRAADPLATGPLTRIARAAGDPAPLTRLALEELKAAEEAGDARARADAYEQLARVDAELRGDPASALLAWESAAQADPSRQWVLRQVARAYIAQGKTTELLALRARQIAAIPKPSQGGSAEQEDAVALGLDQAALAEKEGFSDDEVRAIYQDIVERDRRHRYALFQLESMVRRAGSSAELADLEQAIADLFADDARSRAAFLTRAGETLAEIGQLEAAIERFKAADALLGGYVPALQGWRFAAMKAGLWIDVADSAAREAAATADASHRARLYHLAGVALMDRALAGERAVPVLRKALAADPRHHDAFVRLRILLDEQGEQDDLVRLLEERLVHEDGRAEKIALHRALARLYRDFLGDRESAKYNLRAILELEANDLRAVATLSDICWEQGAWAEAADALVARARLERDPGVLRQLYYRLGTIYADRLPQPELALKAFQRVLAADPDDLDALARIADLAIATGEWKNALGACERLVKAEQDPARRVPHLHRVGRVFEEGLGDRAKAERAYRMALDGAPDSEAALTRLVEFYQHAGDLRSVRVHLDRVALLMRKRLEARPDDGVAAKVIARAMAARQGAGVVGSLEVARVAAELARALGAIDEGDAEAALISHPISGDLRPLARPEADDLLFPRAAPPELRQIFALLGERVAKHVGVDLRPYGVTRGDRLRARENPVATIAQELADQLGLGEIDVYVSQKQPLAMQAEPTSPVSLVIGAQLARNDALHAVRFAAGAALKLAQSQLALVARMGEGELAALVIALLRLFVPDMPYLRVDQDQVATQLARLRRLIPSNLMTELRPYALAIDLGAFDHEAFQRAVVVGGLRAGVRASGSLGIALQVLAAQRGVDLAALLADPVARELVQFAVGEDHARLVQLAAP